MGEITTYTGSDAAANVEWTETVPTGKVWRLLAIRASLVTDANAATRRVGITITDGTNTLFKANAESTQIASLTNHYNVAVQPSRAVADIEHYIPLPADMLLPEGCVIASVTLNRQVTDNWGIPVFLVEEFDQ